MIEKKRSDKRRRSSNTGPSAQYLSSPRETEDCLIPSPRNGPTAPKPREDSITTKPRDGGPTTPRQRSNDESLTPKHKNNDEALKDKRSASVPENSTTLSRLSIRRPTIKTPKTRWRSQDSSNSVFISDDNDDTDSPVFKEGRDVRKWSMSTGIVMPRTRKHHSDSATSTSKPEWSRAHRRLSLVKVVSKVIAANTLQPLHHSKRRPSKLDQLRDFNKKQLLKKFRLVGKLTVICLRLFKAHSLREKEHEDEVSPFIKGLHFHDYDTPTDLLFDRSIFKANKSMRVPEETKKILCTIPRNRTEREIYVAQIALRNIKAIADYPQNMQLKIAQVGQYERYEAKRIVLRQGHPASAYYFVLSGEAVVMVMDESRTYARPAFHINKGGDFGELSIIQGTKRNATIICKEPCEFLSIAKKDYKRIFMSGGAKSLGDPDQEKFLRSLSFLDGWPLDKLKESPDKTKFLYFKRGDILAQDSNYYDWIVVVKSGSVRILKKLKKVVPFEWKKKAKVVTFVSTKEKRDNQEKRNVNRRILAELKIPLRRNVGEEDDFVEEYPGKPRPFQHPLPDGSKCDNQANDDDVNLPDIHHAQNKENKPRNSFPKIESQILPRLAEGKEAEEDDVDEDDDEEGEDEFDDLPTDANSEQLRQIKKSGGRGRRRTSVFEKEKELMGFKEHKRTIQDDLAKKKELDDITEADLRPEFVEVQTLTKGHAFGLADLILEPQPSFCIVSNGADIILIDKEFYVNNASDALKNKMRQELCPFPTDEEMQNKLQQNVDWSAYRTETMTQTLDYLKTKREQRMSLTA
ncbi:uncharacterized protein LOC110447650 isoform X2 [Mizuhopecten yessoensis]|uniref:Cyclic nucleotide-binding domain-containing protein 2 n=1 Tax=Mizuhopecten yessoensis TaxID=6573 RepID=A0A210QUY8_MIZYE|nr:uncharacterized protein LOC110447650 isoform X2 [Mizuhopecten yessoensis]OWF52537.1 Cyclic nucleotide-binding domain-containing protein 2 [Mizuhopecten yessoensis]